MYRYDPKVNQWVLVAPMLTRRKHLGVAVVDSVIFAVGGRDEQSELNTVERHVNSVYITHVPSGPFRRSYIIASSPGPFPAF